MPYQYTGNGMEFYEGVPMRDLSDDDVAALAEAQQAAVKSGKLYAEEKPAPKVQKQPDPPVVLAPAEGGNA